MMHNVQRQEMKRQAAIAAASGWPSTRPAVPANAKADGEQVGSAAARASAEDNARAAKIAAAWGPLPNAKPSVESVKDAQQETTKPDEQSPAEVDSVPKQERLALPAPGETFTREWKDQFVEQLKEFQIGEIVCRLAFDSSTHTIIMYMMELSKKMKMKWACDEVGWWVEMRKIMREIDTFKIRNRMDREFAEMCVAISRAAIGIPFSEKHIKRKSQMYSMLFELAARLESK